MTCITVPGSWRERGGREGGREGERERDHYLTKLVFSLTYDSLDLCVLSQQLLLQFLLATDVLYVLLVGSCLLPLPLLCLPTQMVLKLLPPWMSIPFNSSSW